MATSAYSIIKSTKQPEKLVIHLVLAERDVPSAATFMGMGESCHVRQLGGAQVIIQYLSLMDSESVMPDKIKSERLAKAQNYVRFALDRFVDDENAIVAWVDA